MARGRIDQPKKKERFDSRVGLPAVSKVKRKKRKAGKGIIIVSHRSKKEKRLTSLFLRHAKFHLPRDDLSLIVPLFPFSFFFFTPSSRFSPLLSRAFITIDPFRLLRPFRVRVCPRFLSRRVNQRRIDLKDVPILSPEKVLLPEGGRFGTWFL